MMFLMAEVIGQTFPIIEEDIRDYILRRLKNLEGSGELYSHQLNIQKRIKETILRPNPVQNIAYAKERRTYYYDPTYTAKRDIKDDKGKIIVSKGTTINPLKTVILSTQLVFVDGDNQTQVSFANHLSNAKIILVKGSPVELERQTCKPIFFDQMGVICREFGIEKIPAVVQQVGLHLRIDEIPVGNQ